MPGAISTNLRTHMATYIYIYIKILYKFIYYIYLYIYINKNEDYNVKNKSMEERKGTKQNWSEHEISFSHSKWVVGRTLNVKLVDLQALNYLIK
jgi:hypothetical protein